MLNHERGLKISASASVARWALSHLGNVLHRERSNCFNVAVTQSHLDLLQLNGRLSNDSTSLAVLHQTRTLSVFISLYRHFKQEK